MLDVLSAENLGSNVTRDQLRPYMNAGFRWHSPQICHPPHTPADEWWAEVEPIFVRAFCEGAGLAPSQGNLLAKKIRQTFLDPSRWSLFPDSLLALESLTARGWQHILLTNHVPELPQLLHALGLDALFAAIFNSADTGIEKPHRAAFENVLSSLPAPTRVWMVGDNPVADIQGAEAAGIPAILVRRPHASVQRYAADLFALVAILDAGVV